jgi:acyl-CoA synthetase (AMP-forming)/AMP-acid ligase II
MDVGAPARSRVPLATLLSRFGDRPALITDERTVSYAELACLVEEEGRRLGPSRRLVLVAVQNDLSSVVGYLGALAAGHVVLLAADRDDVVDGLVAAYDPDVVMRPGSVVERRDGSAHDLYPDLALLLSTSGSTGSPRLVRLSAQNLQSNADAIGAYLSIRDDDVAITTLPLHYCYGLSVLHSHLNRGAAVLLTSLSVVDRCFWDLARRHRVTSLAGVPYTYDLLDRVGFDRMELPSLRYLTQAGGRMDPGRVRRYAELGRRRGFDLFVMYGQTEATARMAYLPPDLALSRPGAVGVPVPGGQLRIDPDGEETGVGELVYAGPNVMLGYAEAPADLALGRVVHELRTGDLARRAADGLVEIVGRTSRFAKVYGLRIDLEQVERQLGDTGHRIVCASADDKLAVAVETAARRGRRALADRVGASVRRLTGLPPSAVRVVPVEDLPRLANGKPDLQAVAALAAEPEPAEAEDVASTYALVLGRDRVSPGDTFVSLGGDSLSYVEMSVRLERLLGHLPENWHLRPVAELEATTRVRGRRTREVETNAVLRAVAIVAIVGTHGNLFTLPGGAHLLLALVGFNLARFQLTPAPRLDRCRGLLRAAGRIAVPAVLWIGAVALVTGAYPWQTALLVNGLAGPSSWSEPEWHYWFIEALVVTVLAMAALVAVPALDRAERRWPFWFPAVLAVLALSTRFELLELRGGDQIHRAHVLFWLVALGWAAARAETVGHRAVVSVLALVSVPGFFDQAGREAFVLLGVLALIWVPRTRLPAFAAPALGVVAASSLWVYLTHWQVYPHLEDRYPWAAVAASFVVGIAAWRAAEWLTRSAGVLAARVRRRPRQPVGTDEGPVSALSPLSSTGVAPVTTLTATRVPTG